MKNTISSTNQPSSTTREAREDDPLLPSSLSPKGSIAGDDKTAQTAETMGSDEDTTNDFVGTVVETVHDALESVQETTTELVETVQEKTHEFVENAQEMTAEVIDNVQETVKDVQEDLMEEAADLKDVVEAKLHEAEEGDMPIMDMCLTRHLTILPADITHVAAVVNEEEFEMGDLDLEATENAENAALPLLESDTPQHVKVPVSAFLMLGIAIIGLASVGPILDLQQGCSPLMKTVWRQNGTILLMLPFVPFDWKKHGFPKLSCAQWTNFVAAAAAYSAGNVCFVTALEYTAVGNAVIFANSQAIILLVGKLFSGSHITLLETAGALTAFGGAALCSKDSASSTDTAGSSKAILGDFIATLGALSGVFYIICATSCRAHFSLFNFMFLVMVVSTAMTILFQILTGEDVTFGMDRETGIWGFLLVDQFDRFPLEFINVVVCNICGAFGYVQAMQYFDSLVIAVAGLMQPVVAEFVAFFIGVSLLPGLLGWLGNLLVFGGTIAVVYKPHTKAKSNGEELIEV